MPRSAAETSKRALARIQRLCCLGVGGEVLMPDLMREVFALIPAQNGFFRWVGPNLNFTKAYTRHPGSAEDCYLSKYHGTSQESALIMTYRDQLTSRAPSLVRSFWPILRVDRHTWFHSDFYNECFRPANNYESLMVIARDGSRSHGILNIWRTLNDVPFEPRDSKMLEAIAGFVAHGLTPATPNDPFVESEDRVLVVAGRDGRIQHASAEARQLLKMMLDSYDASHALRLHEPVIPVDRICRLLVATANGQVGQPPPVVRVINPWGKFVLRAYWLEPTDGVEQTRHIGITIERREPLVLALRRRIEEMPLTGREKQLCLLLTHDRSRQDLADVMGVSTGTVITHQSSIYAKLGVHSRVELLAALQNGQ